MKNTKQLSDLEIEKVLLGTALTSSEDAQKICDSMEKGSFSNDNHNVIYDAIKELNVEGKEISAITVAEKLASKGKLDEIGGSEYLEELINSPEQVETSNASNVVSNPSGGGGFYSPDYNSGNLVYNPVSSSKAMECLIAMRDFEQDPKFGNLKGQYDETERYAVADGSAGIDKEYYTGKATYLLAETIRLFDEDLTAFDDEMRGKIIASIDDVKNLKNDSDDKYVIEEYEVNAKELRDRGLIGLDKDMEGLANAKDKITALEELSKKVESGEITDADEYLEIRNNIEANFSRITLNEAKDLIGSVNKDAFVEDISGALGIEVNELKSMSDYELAKTISEASLGAITSLAAGDVYNVSTGSTINTVLSSIQGEFYRTKEGQKALWNSFIENSDTPHDEENAIGTTEYIKYCISKGREDEWLIEELHGVANIVKMINLNDNFSATEKIVDGETISQIEEYKKAGGSLPYNISCIDGEYYQTNYTVLGEEMLYYMDYHWGENTGNYGENRILTAFSKQAQLDAYERNYKGEYILNHTTVSDEIGTGTENGIARVQSVKDAERDYYILNGLIKDDKRLAELKAAGEKSFSELVNGISEMDSNGNSMYDFSVEGVSEEDIEKYGLAGAYQMHQNKVIASTLGVASIEGIAGLAKSVENIGDAINMAVHSDANLSGINKEYFGIKKEYNELQEKYWNEFINDKELYDAQLKEYLDDPKTYARAVESFKTTYYDPNTGNYSFKGKTYSRYEDIPTDIQQEQINYFMNTSFKRYKMDEWSLESSASSNIYLASFKEGVRNCGNFETFNALDDVIVRNANEQFETMREVVVDKVGDFTDKHIRSKDWYNDMEAHSLVKQNNILGMTANQIGNMALPVLSSMVPGVGQVLSSGLLFTSAFGGAAEESLTNGGNYNQTLQYATLSAATELLIEKAFSGIAGFGEGWMDNVLEYIPNKIINATNLSDSLMTQITKKMLTNGLGEGIEEITTDLVTPLWQSLTYLNEKSYGEIFKENVSFESEVETFLVSFLTSMVFGTSNISRQYKHFNNQMNNLQVEIGKIPGMRETTNKIFAEILATDVNMTSPEILNKIIEKNGQQLAESVSKNSDATSQIEALQQKLKEAQEKMNNNQATITINGNEVKLSNNLVLTIADIGNLNGNFEISEEGNITFKNESAKAKFINALYSTAKNQLSSIGTAYTEEIKKHQKELLSKNPDYSTLGQAIQTIMSSETDISKIITYSNAVKVKIGDSEFDVPRSIIEKVNETIENEEEKFIVDESGTELVLDQNSSKRFANGIIGNLKEIRDTQYSNKIVELNRDATSGKYEKAEEVIELLNENYDSSKESSVVITKAEQVDGKDLIKLEVAYNEKGTTREVNVYVDSTTDPNVYRRDSFVGKVSEEISKNEDTKNIYVGKLEYDKKERNIVEEINDDNKSFVESRNNEDKISSLTHEQQTEKQEIIVEKEETLSTLADSHKAQVRHVEAGYVYPTTAFAKDKKKVTVAAAGATVVSAATAVTAEVATATSTETNKPITEKQKTQSNDAKVNSPVIEEALDVSEKHSNDTEVPVTNTIMEIIDVSKLDMSNNRMAKTANMNLSYEGFDYVVKPKSAISETIDNIISNPINGKVLIEMDTISELSNEIVSRIPDNVQIRIIGSYTDAWINSTRNQHDAILSLKRVTYTKEELIGIVNELEKFYSGINPEWTDMQKAKYAYDYLTNRKEFKYDPDPAGGNQGRTKNYESLTMLIPTSTGRISTCQGFAHTYQALLNKMGIECYQLTGRLSKTRKTRGGSEHAFNAVLIDGKTFIVDTVKQDQTEAFNKGTGFGVTSISEYNIFKNQVIDENSVNSYANENGDIVPMNGLEINGEIVSYRQIEEIFEDTEYVDSLEETIDEEMIEFLLLISESQAKGANIVLPSKVENLIEKIKQVQEKEQSQNSAINEKTTEKELSEEALEKVVAGIPYELAREIEREKNRNLSEKAMGGLFYTTKELSQKLKSGSIVNLSEKEIRSIANEIIKGKIHLDNYSIDLKSVEALIEKGVSGDAISRLKNYTQIKLARVYEILIEKYGKEEAYIRLKEYANTGNSLKITREKNARVMLESVERSKVINFVNRLGSSLNNSVNAKNISPRKKQINDIERFISLYGKSNGEIYSPYVTFDTPKFNTLPTRAFLENRYRGLQNVETFYWTNQGGITNRNLTNETGAFFNISIGREPTNVPYGNSYKIYLPVTSESFQYTATRVFDYMIKNNIASENKIANTARSDAIVLRIYDINDAIDVLNLISSDPNIPSNSQGIPFVMRTGKASIAMDGNLSYNSVSTDMFQAYSRTTINPTIDGFKIYLDSILKQVYNDGNLNDVKSIFGFNLDATGYVNHLQVIKLLRLSIDENVTINTYLQNCLNNQNSDKVFSDIRFIQCIMNSSSNTWQHQYHAQSSLTTIDINEYQNPNASLVINYENTQKVELPNYLVEEFGTSAIERFKNTINNKEKLIDMFNQADKRMISLTNKFFEYLYNEYEVINEDSRVDLYDEKLRSIELLAKTMEKGYKVLNVEEVINNNSLPISLSFDLLSKYSERTFEILNNILSLEKNKLGNYVKTLNKPEIQEVLKLLNEEKFSSGSNENIFEFVSKTAEDKKMSIIDKISKNIFKQNRSITLSKEYHQFETIYKNTKKIDIAIESLEKAGYKTTNIADVILSYGYNGNSIDITRAFYYKAFDYLVEKGIEEKRAAEIIRNNARKIVSQKGTRIIATTKSGINIRIINGANLANVVISPEQIQEIIEEAERMYANTNLKDIIIQDTFDPDNIYSEKVQYEDYVKNNINKRFIAEASANSTSIEIFTDLDEIYTLFHEYAHCIDFSLLKDKDLSNTSEWINAIKLDKEITFDPITEYATTSNAEDFAEFISEFKKKPIEIGMKYPNRYRIASKYLNLEIDEKVLEKYDSIEIIEYLERVTSSSFVDVLNSYINDTLENKSIAKFLDKRYTNKVELIREVGLHDLIIKTMIELGKNKQEILPIIKDYMDGKENALPKQHTNLLNQFSYEEIKEYYDEEKNSNTGEPILDIPLEVLSESFIDVSENVPNESDFADTYSNVQNKEFDVEAFHESYQKLNEDEKVLKLESLTDEQLAAYFEKHLSWAMFDVIKSSKDDNFKIRAYKNTNSNYLSGSAEILSTISDENIKLELIESEKENIEVGLLVATLSDDEFKVNYLKNCNSKNHDVIHEIIKSLKDETLIDKIFNETSNIVVKEYIISTKNNDELKMKFLDEFGNGLSSDGILLILISFKNANEKIKYVKKYKDALPPYDSNIGSLIKSINNVDLKMECLKLFKVKDNFSYRRSVMRTLESISEQEFKSEYLIDYKDIMRSNEIIRIIESLSSDELKLECLKGCADVLDSYDITKIIELLSSDDSKIAYTIEFADKLEELWIKSIIASLSDDELKIKLLNKTRSNFEYGISSVVSNLDLDENKLVFLEDSTNGFSDLEKVTIINSIKSKSLRKDCLSNKNIMLDEDYIGDVIATLSEKDKLKFLDNNLLSDKSRMTVIKSLSNEQRKKYIKTIHSSEYRAEVITLFESDNEKLEYLNDDTFILAIEDKANIVSSIKDDEIKIEYLNNNKGVLDGDSKVKIIKSLDDSLKGQYVIDDAWNFTSYEKKKIISSIQSNYKLKLELLKKTKLDINDFLSIVRNNRFTNEEIYDIEDIKEQIVKDPEFSYLQRISTALTESLDVEKLRLINLMTFDSNTIIELFDKGELKVIKAIYEYYNNGVELVKNTLNDNLKALKIIEVYNSLNENTAEVFKKYLFEEFNGVTRHDKFEITNIEEVAKLITRISTSNAIELRNSQSGFADMLLKQPKPLESLEKVEEIFLRNNLPYVGKVMKVFQTLYSRNLDVINSNLVNMQRDLSRAVNIFKYDVISPYLKSKWEIGDNVKVVSEMERVIFRDLIRISLRSNNKSMKDYIENIKVGNKIFESIETKEDFDNLTSQEKETLEIFASHLDMLYNSLKGRTLSKENLSLYENIGRMKRVFTRNYKYNLPDSIISIFCHEAGFDTIEEVENYMNEELVKIDTRNREYAYKLLSTNEGVIIDQYDVLKGIGNVKYLESMLQNGIVPGELIAEEPSYDTTPLGIDWWMKTFEGKESLYAALKRSGAIDHGYPIHIVMANEDHSFTITRTNEVKKSEHTQNFIETKIDEETFDLNKPEFYYCGSDQKNRGYDHYDSRTGVSFADIRCIVTDQSIARNNQELYDFTQTIAFEIAKNGYYIPIVDRVTGKVIFTPEEFDILREKMTGMSYYGMNEYNYSETLKSTSDIVTNELFEYLKTTCSSFVKIDIIQEIIGNKSIGIVGKITTDVIEEFKLIENGNIDKLPSEKIIELYEKFENGEFDSIIRTKINSGESLSTLLRLSELDVVRKRNVVNNAISDVLKEFDLSLKTKIDGDITPGYVEVIDTGSTGRKSNVPGDGDFDFTVRIDADKFNNPEFMSKLSSALRTKFESLESTKTENDSPISKGTIGNDIRYENVKLDGLDVLVDIDISFIQKTNKVEYSTDMSLSDRYSQMDSNTQNLVIANVIRIKQLMKEYGCYKPSRKDENQSGLGGVGYENLILQSGGSLLDAAMSFIEGTRTITYKEYLKTNKNAMFIEYLDRTKENIKTFSEFYQTYSLWDFGKNHFAEKKDAYPHDNFVDNMTSDRKTSNGYSKIIEAFESYIKSVDSHTEKNKKNIIGDFEIFDVSNETKNDIGKSDNVEMIDESVISTTELPKQRKASNKTELDAKETNTGDVSNNFNDIIRDKKLTIDEKIKKVLTIALSSNNLDIANAYKDNLYMKLAEGQEKEITTKIEKTCESILKERGYEKILEVNIGGTENIVIEAVKDFKGDLNGLVDFINKHIPKMIAMYENPLKLEKIVINDTFSPKDCYFKWKTNNSNFEAEATVDYEQGIINLWGSFAESKDPSTLYHEYAHLVQRELSRKHNDFEEKWVNAVKEDDAYITEYAKQDLTEDFAETFGIFHDGNQLEVASKFIHRYYVLSKYNLEIMLSEKEILSVIYDSLNRKKIDFSSTLNEFFKTGKTSKCPVIASILKEYQDLNEYQNLKEHLNFDNGVYSLKEKIRIKDSIIPKEGSLNKEDKFSNDSTSASIFSSFKKSGNHLFDEVLNTGNITNLNETELIDLIYEIKMKKINLKNYELNSESVRLLIDKGIKISSIYPLFYIGPVNAFIRHFGIDVISRFEELNNGFLLGNGGQTLDDIFNSINGEFSNMNQADKYDELEKLIEKAINSKFEFDYQDLEGSEFATKYPELFLDENVPQDIKDLYYNKKIDDGNRYEEKYFKYLEGKSIGGVITIKQIPLSETNYLDYVNDHTNAKSYNYRKTLSLLSNRLRMTPEEIQQIFDSKIQELIVDSAFGVRRTINSLEKILDDGKFKNQFEIKTSSHGIKDFTLRMEKELEQIGVPTNLRYEDRPVYGMLLPNIEGDNIYSSYKYLTSGPGSYYSRDDGVIYIFDKEKIINNATISLGDTITFGVGATNMNDPKFFGRFDDMLRNINTRDDLEKFDLKDAYTKFFDILDRNKYYEFQLHGEDSHRIDKIKEILFMKEPSDEIKQKLRKMNIPFRIIVER